MCLVLYGKYWISHRSKFRTYGEISNELASINKINYWISDFFGRNLSRLLEAPVYCSRYSS